MTNSTVQAAQAMREAAAKKLAFMQACLPDGTAKYQLSHAEVAIRALPLPEPPPDLRDATISRLSADLEAAREALEPFSKIPIGAVDVDGASLDRDPDDLVIYQTHCWPSDQTAQVILGDFRRARAVLAKISKGA